MYDSSPNTESLLFFKKNSNCFIITCTIFQISTLVVLSYFSIIKSHKNEKWFWITLILKLFLLSFVMWVCGYGVENYNWKVSYTRKVVHAVFFSVPFIFDIYLPLPKDDIWLWSSWNFHIIIWLLLLITKPVRRNISIIQTMYVSSDRPEDKGLSQIYATIQIPLSMLVICVFYVIFEMFDKTKWILIPTLSVALGDGMAEPVAQFIEDCSWYKGPHKYKVKGLFSGDREFTRSIEGSTVVFIGTLVSVLLFYSSMNTNQLIFATVTLPITTTILEFYSLHSMDNPVLLLWGNLIMFVAIFI